MTLTVFACSSTGVKMDGGGDTAHVDAATIDVGNGDADDIDASTGATDGDAGGRDVYRQPLCDGVQHLRLWVLVESGGQQAAGSRVRTENGSPVIAIDGTCSFWVGGGWSEDALRPDRPFHTGTLAAADVRALEESVPLDDINALADCPGPPGGLFDYDTREIRTAMATVTCPGSSGTRFEAAWKTVQTIADNLWKNGTPMDGAIRVSAVPANWGPSTPPTPYAWPVAAPLSSFILASADRSKTGVSRLVDDVDSARQLRAMRDQYLADRMAQPGLYGDGLRATDEITPAVVYMRDAIPYEDAQGLLKF